MSLEPAHVRRLLNLEEQIMDSIVNFDKRIRSGCSGNSTAADKQTLFNQYYPPCLYDKGSDTNSQPKNLPCLPYPGAPQPCDKNSKTPCLSKVKDKPCVKTNFKSKKQREPKKVNLAYSVVNAPISGRK